MSMLRKVVRCTIWACDNEADGECASCKRLLCYVHALPLNKQYYCYECHNRLFDKLAPRYRGLE